MKQKIIVILLLLSLVLPSTTVFADSGPNDDGKIIESEQYKSLVELQKLYESRGMKQDALLLNNFLSQEKAKRNLSQSSLVNPKAAWYMIDSYSQGLAENTTGSVNVARVAFGYANDHWATVRSRYNNETKVKIKRLQMTAYANNGSGTRIYTVSFGFDDASDVFCRRTDAPSSGYARSDVDFTFASAGTTTLWAGDNY
jgi:hypothetical protein